MDNRLTPKQKKRLDDLFKKRKDKGKRFDPKQYGKPPKGLLDKLRKKKKDGVIDFKELEKRLKKKPKVMEAKKGGSAKFPDLSGDGKVTQKDILMGRGVIKRKNGGAAAGKPKNVPASINCLRAAVGKPKKKRNVKDIVKKVIEGFKNKPKVFGDIIKTGPITVPRPKLPKPKKPGEITTVPRPKLPKLSDMNKPRTVTPAKRKKPRKMATGGVAGRLAQRGYGKARS